MQENSVCGTAMDNTTVKACPTESFYGSYNARQTPIIPLAVILRF